MKRFNIYNNATGADLGTYPGATAAEALDAMARAAGYADYSSARGQFDDDNLIVTEVQ